MRSSQKNEGSREVQGEVFWNLDRRRTAGRLPLGLVVVSPGPRFNVCF